VKTNTSEKKGKDVKGRQEGSRHCNMCGYNRVQTSKRGGKRGGQKGGR